MTFDMFSLILIGAVVAGVLQALQKFGRIPTFLNAKLFVVLILLSAACWIISLALGGWIGLSLSGIGLSMMMVAVSGLVISFFLNLWFSGS
ncbi:hypothetical protein [Rossellomorea vietnamensis]|uniref:hypothetical protein n=1 Tax=Rossellomorea vietnamensis TaxID=218284 RepID=UPI001E2A5562|nr:hypothetical protein [Rossellomorea vietnamensis]MCC5800843.1 hypothetical protein [Rossellomorea vietnamensis]